MKYLSIIFILIGLCSACSEPEEDLLGEWEGTTERVSDEGKPIEVNVSCTIASTSGTGRSVTLSVSGVSYEFIAKEDANNLTYMDSRIENDTARTSYISGGAELLNDTLLRFDHKVYAMKNNALLYSNDEMYDMVRK